MKVLVTGAAGFLGQRLIAELLRTGRLTGASGQPSGIDEIVAVDLIAALAVAGVRAVVGDVSDPAFLAAAVRGADSVFHLAAVVSGAAEADLDLGMRGNLDGTRALLDALRNERRTPRVVYASSVAVFGGTLPATVTDTTAPRPQSSYGVQKLIGELLVGDYSRKAMIDGRAVRLPTIVVRPGKPNAAASSFASAMIREPLAGVQTHCPVDADASMWLMSPAMAVANLIHAHETPAARWGHERALNLPGISVSVRSMLEALRVVGGQAAHARVTMQPDPRIQAIVQGWPACFTTTRADAMGFVRDSDFESIVRDYAREHLK